MAEGVESLCGRGSWCAMNLTDREREIVATAWELGREYERARPAELVDDLNRVDLRPHKSYEDRVAERVALFEQCAAELHKRQGTRPFTGVRP